MRYFELDKSPDLSALIALLSLDPRGAIQSEATAELQKRYINVVDTCSSRTTAAKNSNILFLMHCRRTKYNKKCHFPTTVVLTYVLDDVQPEKFL